MPTKKKPKIIPESGVVPDFIFHDDSSEFIVEVKSPDDELIGTYNVETGVLAISDSRYLKQIQSPKLTTIKIQPEFMEDSNKEQTNE